MNKQINRKVLSVLLILIAICFASCDNSTVKPTPTPGNPETPPTSEVKTAGPEQIDILSKLLPVYMNIGTLTSETPGVTLSENWEEMKAKDATGTGTVTFDGYEYDGYKFYGTIQRIGEKSVSQKIKADIQVGKPGETHTIAITINSPYNAANDEYVMEDMVYFTLDGVDYCFDTSKILEP